MGWIDRFRNTLAHAKSAYDSFNVQERYRLNSWGGTGGGFGFNPTRSRNTFAGDKTVVTSIYNQIAIDVAAVPMNHVRIDVETGRYVETLKTTLNDCLTLEANIDEGARAFRQNIAMSLFDKGVAAICIMKADNDPGISMSYNIEELRVGEVSAWFPDAVRVLVYNENTGNKEEITLPKRQVAIVENPMFAVMNDDNSTLKRLTRKLSLLDAIDEQAGSGKLDIIIQLPYVVKSESRKQQAAQRRQDMEEQLYNSKYGVAYADATEKITQLNRPAENNMLAQVEYLTKQLFSQLGIPKDVFEGTSDEKMMLNYYNRTVEPILTAICEGMERKFISKTARSQGQAIRFYRDPFKNATLADFAEIGDKFSRNEIVTGNELRSFMGMKPSKEAKADKLQNANMPNVDNVGKVNQAKQSGGSPDTSSDTTQGKEGNLQNGSHGNQYTNA
jgi:Phage portal protein